MTDKYRECIGWFFSMCAAVCVTSGYADDSNNNTGKSLEELANMELSTLPKDVTITTPSKYPVSLRYALASVRVLTNEDIRTYGFRTLGEALQSLPGVYVTHDRNYSYVGVRGFNRPGDYNSRILLLIDGARVNDAVWDSFLAGYDFFIDIDLIKRIEYMPGPGSAIYGNNALFAVINVITKRGNDYDGGELAGSYGSFDTYKGRGTYGQRYDNGLETLLSFTTFDRQGPYQLYYPEYDTPANNYGKAISLDYDRSISGFGKISYKGFTLEGFYIDRNKGIPTASFGQAFNARESGTEDKRGMLMLTYNNQIAVNWNMYGRFNYNRYDYRGNYVYDSPTPSTINRDVGTGEWWGGELRLVNTSFTGHKVVMGAEVQDNPLQFIKNFDIGGPTYIDKLYRSTRYGVYLQDEYQVIDPVTIIFGGRYDYNPLGGNALNPRVGLIWEVSNTTTLKLLYGSAYRAPNTSELFGAVLPTKTILHLRPEKVKTFELIASHFFTPSLRASGSVYHYQVYDLISQASFDTWTFYQNQGEVYATGIEIEGEQRFENGIHSRLSYTWQQTRNQDNEILTNSPQHQFKLNVSVPLWFETWRVGYEMLYTSKRRTRDGTVGDYVLGSINLTGNIYRGTQLSFGLYNILNAHYADPVGEEFVQQAVYQDGRSFRIKLNVSF